MGTLNSYEWADEDGPSERLKPQQQQQQADNKNHSKLNKKKKYGPMCRWCAISIGAYGCDAHSRYIHITLQLYFSLYTPHWIK